MRIIVASIFVRDQGQALEFYTTKLGFIKKHDFPVQEFRYLTLVSPEDPSGTELILVPNNHPPAKKLQKAMFAGEVPATVFAVADLRKEHQCLLEKGVVFTMDPTQMDDAVMAVFDDTCGNLIQLLQM